jgi:hypothetical protein
MTKPEFVFGGTWKPLKADTILTQDMSSTNAVRAILSTKVLQTLKGDSGRKRTVTYVNSLYAHQMHGCRFSLYEVEHAHARNLSVLYALTES